MNYGEAIKKARGLRAMSQRQLAEESQVDASYISLVETGQRMPSMKMVEAIAGALRVPLYLLIFMASGEAELRGISQEQASVLGQQLLKIVMADGPDV